jgi:hypothetical protein
VVELHESLPLEVQLTADDLDDTFNVRQYVRVCETHNTIAHRPELGSPRRIVTLLLGMLRSIQFKNQLAVGAAEVRKIPIDRNLTAEFRTVDLPIA